MKIGKGYMPLENPPALTLVSPQDMKRKCLLSPSRSPVSAAHGTVCIPTNMWLLHIFLFGLKTQLDLKLLTVLFEGEIF